ncbi:DUF2683 family protein [Pedobacter sp. CFBP9032]|uniref:DUF2683 family protein n=1 Tax=Pedobacter sp. CFBP9032 TaxID=3096539 RepID=UPI002A6B39B4|nr:DUF2683 family protein [Pedobacter sp. CFBP9032]MDY0907043.1 hypothetical protein [Pedobacter sp. CFBP9032]
MTIATIQIPDKKATLVKQLLKELGVKIMDEKIEKSPYNPEFVAKIKKADEEIKQGQTKKIPVKDLWK